MSVDCLKIYIPGREFVLPYIKRELGEYDIVLTSSPDDCNVAIINPNDVKTIFNKDTTILVCPNIVGTGMTGLPMDLARRIARGSYYHLEGNDARISTIHASDVARAVRLSLGTPGTFTVTDCVDPTFHDFAEALAWRINQKRIITLSSKWVRWIISPSLRRIITKDLTFDGKEFANRFGFTPTPLTEYLRNHNYDDESL